MALSTPLSVRLPKSVADELVRLARLSGRPPASVAARLIVESLRMQAVPGIYFKDTLRGRSAAVMGTGLQVWQMCDLIHSYEGDIERILLEFPGWTKRHLDAAVQYKEQFSDEIEAAQEQNRITAERIGAGEYPWIRVLAAPPSTDFEGAP